MQIQIGIDGDWMRSVGGFYSAKTRSGLRLICVNSNLWYYRDQLSANETDPAEHFHWMEKEMLSARNDKEKVSWVDFQISCIDLSFEILFFAHLKIQKYSWIV